VAGEVPQGAQLSEDGNYWWDGAEWQLVPQAGAAPETAAAHQGGAAQGGAAQQGGAAPHAGAAGQAGAGHQGGAQQAGAGAVTAEELAAITSEDQINERVHPYLAPDYDKVPDDTSYAEAGDVLGNEAAAGMEQA
jgi:hypothetical protein